MSANQQQSNAPTGATEHSLAPSAGSASEPPYGEYDEHDGEGEGCYQCGGAGYIVTCIDDLCRGAGECMHGDGESPCPNCNRPNTPNARSMPREDAR